MIVATAGHIDHGKTLLVRTLTGVDTDRLPEEKRRGISIDIGFAYLPTPQSGLIGFVDVPGHERFVRNMLAGVCGIDEAMLVVAADDGIMPQTVEHLKILDLLNVRSGLVAVTKIDRVQPARVTEVVDAIKALIADTSLAGSPVFPVSAVAGSGIDKLRARLFEDARKVTARQAAGRRFRFAIDRVFSVAGSGTVVTGTVFNGRVKTGDRLMVSPAGIPVRVRGIQVRGKAANDVAAGQRCALNLTGTDLEKETIRRGDWVLDEAVHRPTRRIDATVKAIASESAAPLEHWTPMHLHLGTSAVTARVAVRRGEAIAPGESRLVQLILDRPIGALTGDRFILRDQSASRTLGGGIVVDPFAPLMRRRTQAREQVLAALASETPQAALKGLAAALPDGIELAGFEAAFDLDEPAAQALYKTNTLVVLGRGGERCAITQARRGQIREAIVAEIGRVHREDPKSVGVEAAQLRATVAPRLPEWALTQLVRELADEKKVEMTGTRVRRPGHDATSNPEDEKLWARIQPELERDKPLPPTITEIAQALRIPDKPIRDLLHRKSRSGEPVKVMEDRFFLKPTILRLAQTAQETAAARPNGQFTAAEFRDRCGASRKLSIDVLEYFDRIGYTQRIGDARRIRRPIEQALGARP